MPNCRTHKWEEVGRLRNIYLVKCKRCNKQERREDKKCLKN
jgi:hypothetical protein